jgi:hypothetical protein
MKHRFAPLPAASVLLLTLMFSLGQGNPVSASKKPAPIPTPTTQPLTIVTAGLYTLYQWCLRHGSRHGRRGLL